MDNEFWAYTLPNSLHTIFLIVLLVGAVGTVLAFMVFSKNLGKLHVVFIALTVIGGIAWALSKSSPQVVTYTSAMYPIRTHIEQGYVKPDKSEAVYNLQGDQITRYEAFGHVYWLYEYPTGTSPAVYNSNPVEL